MLFPIQISTNGLILFDNVTQFQSNIVNSNSIPRMNPPFFPYIAPLWADFNFRDFGTVFYRVATDNTTLDAVISIFRNITNGNYNGFRPTLAIVVTWFQSKIVRSELEVSCELMLTYNNTSYNPFQVTFQTILVTDGKISFVATIYDQVIDRAAITFDIPFSIGIDPGERPFYASISTKLVAADTFIGYRIDGKILHT